jgi:hypothetical protein
MEASIIIKFDSFQQRSTREIFAMSGEHRAPEDRNNLSLIPLKVA